MLKKMALKLPALRQLHEQRNLYAEMLAVLEERYAQLNKKLDDLHEQHSTCAESLVRLNDENRQLREKYRELKKREPSIRAVDYLPISIPRAEFTKGRFYILTALEFNHIQRPMRLDKRLFDETNTEFYFFDAGLDLAEFPRCYKTEQETYPLIADAGRKHLAEWSFLLAEYEKNFAEYPFFMTSSRFYEKNSRLRHPLGRYQSDLFKWLEIYGYGYLPSYDRNLSFVDMNEYEINGWLGTDENTFSFINEVFGVNMKEEGRFVSDFWCNYIGFQSRKHLVAYVDFYLPLIRRFFDDQWNLIVDYREMAIVRSDVNFRQFKPLTLFLEKVSHLFFFKREVPFVGLHYDGFYEVREWRREFMKIQEHSTSGSHGSFE